METPEMSWTASQLSSIVFDLRDFQNLHQQAAKQISQRLSVYVFLLFS